MALEAGALGLRAIFARDAMPGEYSGVRVFPAPLISEPSILQVSFPILNPLPMLTLFLVAPF